MGRSDSGDTGTACAPGDSTCNGLDDDCDGVVDELAEPPTPTWYPDLDGDGYGDSDGAVQACAPPSQHIAAGGDCDDTTTSRSPEAHDIVGDGIDQDCDGADATCDAEVGPLQPRVGDLTLVGGGAAESVAAICASSDGVDGQVTVSSTDWTDLSALGCLCGISGGLVVTSNASLASLDGLAAGRRLGRVVELTDNPVLASTDGLSGTLWTDVVSGDERLDIRRNPRLQSIAGFDGWRRLDRLHIRELAALTTLDGLRDLERSTETVELRDNPLLASVEGLTGLTDASEVRVEDNPTLTSLRGLGGLTSVAYLTLGGNALTDLSDFASLRAIDSRLTLRGAPALTGVSGLVSLERLGGLRVEENPALTSLAGLSDAAAAGGIDGTVELHANPMLTDLTGLDWVSWVDGDFIVGGTGDLTPLTSLHGLEALRFVTGSFILQRVLVLDDLAGLDSLEEVGALRIDGTDQPATEFSLAGAPVLEVVHHTLDIRNHPSLVGMGGLESVHTIGDLLLLDNPELRHLHGLEGLHTADDLIVLRNPRLGDISALYGLSEVGDVCVEVPANPDEPTGLLDTLGTTEVCP